MRDRALVVLWSLADWPLARRWAEVIGLSAKYHDVLFHAYGARDDIELPHFDAIDERELPADQTDMGFWIAQLGWSACLRNSDVHARWGAKPRLIDEALVFQTGEQLGSGFHGGFGFHAGATFDAAREALERVGFEVRRASELVERPPAPRDVARRTDWLEDSAALVAFLRGEADAPSDFTGRDGILDHPANWSEVDRRILDHLARTGELGVVVMRRLTSVTGMSDVARLATDELQEWDLPAELSLAADGTYPPTHGNAATYAALSMARDADDLVRQVEACGGEAAWIAGGIIRMLAFFTPASTQRDFFAERIERVLRASPDRELTRDALDEQDLMVLEELGIDLDAERSDGQSTI